MTKSRELVVISHLRWTFVWQRPQQLITRLHSYFDRTWFVEEAVPVVGLTAPVLRTEDHGPVTRVWLEVPAESGQIGFDAATCASYIALLPRLLDVGAERTIWLYTPMAIDVARSLGPALWIYDVMDDLGSFQAAPPALVFRHRQLLRDANVVFAGGRSLHHMVSEQRADAWCFPSGVEPHHFTPARTKRAARGTQGTPVAGYVGVIDERLDLELIRGLAGALSDWKIELVGPVAKIDPQCLPAAANLDYRGPCTFEELPDVMSRFDVALMPFALNDATRSISPTKTLEYLASGLPVVSTAVADVVADYGDVVWIAEGSDGFADACREARHGDWESRASRYHGILKAQWWDSIATRMAEAVEAAWSVAKAQGA